jgi:hypothetical protein
MKSNAFQWAQVAERLGNIESEEQINDSIEIHSTKLSWLFTLPDFPAGGVAPRSDHGIFVLRDAVKSRIHLSDVRNCS